MVQMEVQELPDVLFYITLDNLRSDGGKEAAIDEWWWKWLAANRGGMQTESDALVRLIKGQAKLLMDLLATQQKENHAEARVFLAHEYGVLVKVLSQSHAALNEEQDRRHNLL